MITLNHEEIGQLALNMSAQLINDYGATRSRIPVYPIPRGGIPVAYALASCFPHKGTSLVIRDHPGDALAFIDDIVDSGSTRKKWLERYPHARFYALVDKARDERFVDEWVTFPWEASAEAGIEDHIVRLLEYVGEDPKREGLVETPKRVACAWKEWCAGYGVDPKSLLKTFEDGALGVDEMVSLGRIPFYSHCEHHLAPFFGDVAVAYIPDGRIVGLSKIARVVKAFAQRLQVQERLTNQIADCLYGELKPKGLGVLVRARHLCMESRGADVQGAMTTTSALRGVVKEKPEARAEFLKLVG